MGFVIYCFLLFLGLIFLQQIPTDKRDFEQSHQVSTSSPHPPNSNPLPLIDYLRGVVGVLFVFDLTLQQSFDNIEYWINFVHKTTPNVVRLLVGNKSDLVDRRV
jgi:hypothetical protein